MGMGNKYENLVHIVGRSPDHLKKLLTEIPVPSTIMPGSWYTSGMKHGVWVVLDRPARKVKAKDLTPTVDVTDPTKTEQVKPTNNNKED